MEGQVTIPLTSPYWQHTQPSLSLDGWWYYHMILSSTNMTLKKVQFKGLLNYMIVDNASESDGVGIWTLMGPTPHGIAPLCPLGSLQMPFHLRIIAIYFVIQYTMRLSFSKSGIRDSSQIFITAPIVLLSRQTYVFGDYQLLSFTF